VTRGEGKIKVATRHQDSQDGEPPVPLTEVMRVFVRKPGFLLNRIDQIANSFYARSAGGETLAQAEMLLAVAALPGSDQVGLARACGIDTSTTAIILGNLEASGLVTRAQDEHDRRRSLPLLTPEGERRLPAVRAAFDALQEELLAPLTRVERSELLASLAGITQNGDNGAPRWDTETSPLSDAPSLLFRRALQISHARFHLQIAPLTITLRQFSALLILHLHPGLSQVEFARVYGLDPSTCAVVLKKLAARGLLRAVRSSEDRRKTLYYTTEEGRAHIAILQGFADQSEVDVLAALPSDPVARLLPPLQKIVRCHSPRLRYPGYLPWDDISSPTQLIKSSNSIYNDV